MTTIDRLGSIAAEVAMKAAAEYIRQHNLTVPSYEAATECLRSWCKMELPRALDDAKAALECGMSQVAEQTFCLSMARAGIEAAKEFGMPKAA